MRVTVTQFSDTVPELEWAALIEHVATEAPELVMAGAFCLSSNGGSGWIIDAEGTVLATTADQEPFVTLDIDLAAARAAKKSYPRYVAE